MAKVRVLPDILAHKIAAGEIVERPASVVKELVENSIDARADSVSVEVTEGGKQRIMVRDDGEGMSRQDARLAFQHHATSKIRDFEDLNRISTLGFRGEALPSIASVSRLRLRTVEKGGEEPAEGTELEFEGGRLVAERPAAWPRGTEIEVGDLFFNVPARRKFLKTVSTEMGHVARQLTHYALAYPGVEFRLSHQGKPLLEAPRVNSLEDRVYQILGDRFLDNLLSVDYTRDGVHVHGFVSLPHEQRSSSRWQHLFVNRRVVRDKVINHALRMSYQDLIPPSSHPVVLLFIDIDPEEVDVNVHPSKTEIRFRRSDKVHRAIQRAIENTLLTQKLGLSSLARDVPLEQFRAAPDKEHRQGVARSLENFFQRQPDSSRGFREFRHSAGLQVPAASSLEGPGRALSLADPAKDPHAGNIPETADLSPVPVVLGQFVESFVVAADREGVMLIDQHVAHERILYDQALRRLQGGRRPAIQRLLTPLTVDLTPAQKAVMGELLEELNSNGFEVEWFGESTIVVKGVPETAVEAGQVPRMLLEVLDSFQPGEIGGNGTRLHRLREKIAISLSCRAAIKINTPLSQDKMQWLVDALFRCRNPHTCPHGRPIILRLGIEDVLRGFKRI